MNFLLHRHLATRALASIEAGHGAMLPDLWRMADRRVRAIPLSPSAARQETAAEAAAEVDVDAALQAGIAHHLDADAWFHGSAVFTDGERLVVERFREAGFVAPRMGLLAHITWELCLDGALVRREGLPEVVSALRAGHERAGEAPLVRAAHRHHFGRVERSEAERVAFEGRMRAIATRLLDGSWIGAYADASGLTDVLGAIRRRLALPALGERDRTLLARTLATVEPAADAALDDLLRSAP